MRRGAITTSMEEWLRSSFVIVACSLSFSILLSHPVEAQSSSGCGTYRAVSTLVGAGLGAAAGAIPATVVHRHDKQSSYRITAVSISAGAVIGLIAASRDPACRSRADSSQAVAGVVASRSAHARRGALTGALIGGVLGAAGSTLLGVGCTREPCHETRTRVNLTLFGAGEGAFAGGLLGGLVGWAWPVRR